MIVRNFIIFMALSPLYFLSLRATDNTAKQIHEIYIQLSPPRCLSTALLRCWQSRGDCVVLNEPFISAYANQDILAAEVSSQWWRENAPMNFTEVEKNILISAEDAPVFVKEESFAFMDYLHANPNLLNNPHVHFIFLIRNPHHSICSYYKGHNGLIANFSYFVGFEPLYEIYQIVKANNPNTPCILSAEEVYSNPAQMIQDMCAALNIDFLEKMLQWEDLGDSFTGVKEWGELKKKELTHRWHGDAINSTAFHKPRSYELDANGNPTFSEIKNDSDRQTCFDAYVHNKIFYDLFLKETIR